jgi:hypothetical protein
MRERGIKNRGTIQVFIFLILLHLFFIRLIYIIKLTKIDLLKSKTNYNQGKKVQIKKSRS